MNQPTRDTIEAIFEVRDRYSFIKEEISQDNESNYLLDLMEIRKELSCLAMDLARSTGDHLKMFKNSSSILYTKRYLKQKELMSGGEKVTAAEAKAKMFVTQEVKDEYEFEANYMSSRIILQQTNELLASVKQDISIIKKDYDSLGDRE